MKDVARSRRTIVPACRSCLAIACRPLRLVVAIRNGHDSSSSV